MLKIFSIFLVMLSLTAIAGCTQYSQSNTVESSPIAPIYEQLATRAPPEPLEEIAQIPDDPPTQVWRPGYWKYENDNFTWVSGKLISRPSSTAVWSPDEWEHRTYGWAFIAGYWQ